MVKITEHKEAHLRRTIRDILALDPLISMAGLQRAMEKKTNRPIDEAYLKKLVRRVTGELAVVADREKVEERIGTLRETNRLIREELFRIAFPDTKNLNPPGVTERRKALEAIARIDNAQVKLEMDLGLFTRHIGQLDVDHRVHPIEDITRENIIKAFTSWSMTSPIPRRIEPVDVLIKNKEKQPYAAIKQHTAPAPAPSGAIQAVTGAGLVVSE